LVFRDGETEFSGCYAGIRADPTHCPSVIHLQPGRSSKASRR
jgi:hypothetical protein